MYCANCGKEIKGVVQAAEDAARRVYSEGQRIDNERVRAIAYSELKRILEEKDKEEYIPHTRAGEPWTECEDRMLKEELATFYAKAAKEHRRSYGAIVSRISHYYTKGY